MMNDHFNHRMKDYSNVEKGLEIIDKNIGLLVKEFPSANFITNFGDLGWHFIIFSQDLIYEAG